MGRRERLFGYAIILQEEADQGNMAPKNRRDREIWRSDTEENTKHKACRERKADKIESPRASTASILRKKNVNIFYLRYCINIQSGRAQQQHADDSTR